ncbi:hypothetical protein MLD38_035035 [Melastoma candidum]|nr:hypothetical protein MLD38_035035 [Melastoma candidum]
MSQKLRKKNQRTEEDDNDDDLRRISMRCLTLYGRAGGCKVGAETSEEFGDPSNRRRSSASEEAKMYGTGTICGGDETIMDCFFSYGVKDRLWRRYNRKYLLPPEDLTCSSGMHVFLPDDILEMCLMRLPLQSLMNARLVCKKWRHLTSSNRFMQMRQEGSHQNPWLFLFGAVKDGFCSAEIHALDVCQDQWHKIEAGILRGRFMFSATSILDEIYIVGGCSSLSNSGRIDRSSFKTHKGALVFSPLTKSWRKMASMKYARSLPILGTFEVQADFSLVHGHQSRLERRVHRSRSGGVSDVYEDPHRLSLRRQQRHIVDDGETSLVSSRKQHGQARQKIDQSSTKNSRRFLLITVGGLGSWDEPLDSAEIYDSASNKWTEIQKLPADFGIACSGTSCSGIFYVYSETDKLAGYDVERGYWIGIQTDPIPPRINEYFPQLVSCQGRLFMLSVSWCEGEGPIGQRNKAVRKLWELDLLYFNWCEASVHPDAPMDWNAAFVADKNSIFGVEMFKIFGQVLNFMTACDVSKTRANWRHISKNQMAHDLDASSCMTKALALVYL